MVAHGERLTALVNRPPAGIEADSTKTAPPSPRSLGVTSIAAPSFMRNGVREKPPRARAGGGAFVRGGLFVETAAVRGGLLVGAGRGR